MDIRKVKNGYITKDGYGVERIYYNIEDLFSALLLHFEGKAKWFNGNSFGAVKVITDQSSAKTQKGKIRLRADGGTIPKVPDSLGAGTVGGTNAR